VPDDWVQIVETDATTYDTNVSVKRKNQMTSKIAPSDADIPNNAHETATWYKDSVGVPPDLLQFLEKGLIVLNMAELVRVLVVPLEIPVRG
jgi:hypothetical protein